MTISDLLENNLFSYPYYYDKDFNGHVDAFFKNYLNLIISFDGEYNDIIKGNFELINIICENILTINAIEIKEDEQMIRFSNLMLIIEKYLFPKDKNLIISGVDSFLYKARSLYSEDFNLQNMFHRPFQDASEIKEYRFSKKNTPCLYLSNSIYNCWLELDKPNFENMAFSRFTTNYNFRYLNISSDLNFLKKTYKLKESNFELFESLKEILKIVFEKFICLFPLYVACYSVNKNKSNNKPEYLIPQLLMEWTKNSTNVDGIIYDSTKISNLKNLGSYGYVNYAIPVKSIKEIGYCEILSQSLKLTKPICGKEYSKLKSSNKEVFKKLPYPPMLFIDQKENIFYYGLTKYGMLEKLLSRMETDEFSVKL